MRPCSTPQCINNATCINILNQSVYDYNCECQYPFYGRRCQLKINLCLNYTCVAKQGVCFVNGTEPECKCFTDFSGQYCQIVSSQLKFVKAVSNGTAVISILIMSTFAGIIVSFDIAKLLGFDVKPNKKASKNKSIKKVSKSKKKPSTFKFEKKKINPQNILTPIPETAPAIEDLE